MWFSLFNALFAYLYINLQNTEISPPRRNHIHTCTRSRPPNLWVPNMASLSRAALTDSPHLDCCASVILRFMVEQQMRHFPWYSTIVSTVNQLLAEPHLSIWSRQPSRKNGASMRRSRRFRSWRIWEVNCRRSWWSCSSTADPRMRERMRHWTLLIWPRRGANWARVDSFWVKLSVTICTQSSFTILRTSSIFSLDIEIIFIFLQHRCMEAFLCSTHLKRYVRNFSRGFFIRQSSMYTSKGVKGCLFLDMSSATGTSSELEGMWPLPPDHMFQKSWPVFLKSSTRSLPLLWGNSRWVGWDYSKSTLNEPTAWMECSGNIPSPHVCSYFTVLLSPAVVSFLSCSLSPSSFFSSILPIIYL